MRRIIDTAGRLLLRLVRWVPDKMALKLLVVGIRLRRLAAGRAG